MHCELLVEGTPIVAVEDTWRAPSWRSPTSMPASVAKSAANAGHRATDASPIWVSAASSAVAS